MGRSTLILDEYVTKTRVPKTTAKKVYRLTDKELELLASVKRANHRFGGAMTLYSRSKVITLACKKYGCTRKNLAEVLEQDNPPIVNQLVERKKPERKKKETPAKAAKRRVEVPASPSSPSSTTSEPLETIDLTM